MEYDTEDLGPGKFKCSIRLPIVNKLGEPMFAEVTHDGKKKECVAACALEACKLYLLTDLEQEYYRSVKYQY